MPRHNVFHIIYSLKQGGAETLLLELVRSSKAHETYSAVVCAWNAGGALEDRFREASPQVRVLESKPRRGVYRAIDFLRLIFALRRLAKRQRARLVHGHLNDSGFLALVVAKSLGLPSVASVYSNHLIPMSLQPGSLKHTVWERVARMTYSCVDRTLAISEEIRDTLMERLNVPEKRIRITPAGSPKPELAVNREQAREILGIGADAQVLLFIGRLVENKNQQALVRMMKTVRQQFPKAVLLLSGEGPDREQLDDLVRSEGLGESVKLLGLYKDLGVLLASADIFVTASKSEGVSIAILEAMAVGLPVVSANCEGNSTTLAEGSGLIVDSDDPEMLAEGIRTVLTDDDRRREMIENAGKRFQEHYSFDKTAKQVFATYDELVNVRVE